MNLKKLIDPNLGSEYDEEAVVRMLFAAFLCIRRSPTLRPKISIVSVFIFCLKTSKQFRHLVVIFVILFERFWSY